MVDLKIERLPHNKIIPEYKTEGSSGMDLSAAINEPIVLKSLRSTNKSTLRSFNKTWNYIN